MALTDGLGGLWHMNGDWLDSFGNNNGTASGATFDSSNQKLGSACGKFDGFDDHVYIADHASIRPSSAMTIMAWVKSEDVTGVSRGFISKEIVDVSGYMLYVTPGENCLFYLYGLTGGFAVATPPLTIGQWHLIIASYDGANIKIYKDGIFINQVAATGTIASNTKDLWFGRYNTSPSTYHGSSYDSVAVWDRALTDGGISVGQTAGGEIAQLWNGGAGIEIGAATFNPSLARNSNKIIGGGIVG